MDAYTKTQHLDSYRSQKSKHKPVSLQAAHWRAEAPTAGAGLQQAQHQQQPHRGCRGRGIGERAAGNQWRQNFFVTLLKIVYFRSEVHQIAGRVREEPGCWAGECDEEQVPAENCD